MPSSKTVLVVEDTQDIAEMFSAMLQNSGCKTVVAHTGEEGVQKALEYRPDLIFMDIRMPGIDGYEATRRILSLPGFFRIPIVAISAHGYGDWAKQARAAGCVDCLNKPVEPDMVNAMVNKYIGSRGAAN
jgi:CheY-like chemotaxis protein